MRYSSTKIRKVITKVIAAYLLSGIAWLLVTHLLPHGDIRFIVEGIAAQFVAAAALIVIYPNEFGIANSKSNTYAARFLIIFLAIFGSFISALPIIM